MIYELLHIGAENGVTLRDLENLTKQDSRTIRKQMENERRAGVPILADCKSGYFLPDSEDEKARFVRSMEHKAAQIVATAKAVEQSEVGA